MNEILPVATGAQVRRYALHVLRKYPKWMYGGLALHGLAALAALAGPRLLGDLVEAVENGTTLGTSTRSSPSWPGS